MLFLDVSEEHKILIFFFIRFFSHDDFCFIVTNQYLNKSKKYTKLIKMMLVIAKIFRLRRAK